MYEPPNGIISATFFESKCSFGMSAKQANTIHKINNAVKPDTKAFQGFWGMATATINAQATKLHQGKIWKRPIAKLNNAVNAIVTINFMF